jgi:2-keto-4-pentenoate hydratase/2-oxohepta-3-ene-1,7-dioic acid hydratase in catechol pathway
MAMTPTTWVRFEHDGRDGFGRLEGSLVRVHEGNLYDAPRDIGCDLPLDRVRLLTPVGPSKMIALWNNFAQLAAKLGLSRPPEPLYFMKSISSLLDPGATIRRPPEHPKIVFEGELVIVIGRRATRVAPDAAMSHVFGFTIANDVTVPELLQRDSTFPQWVRAKGFDTFCPIGPAIATGLDPATLTVRTRLDGELRQDYPVSDAHFDVPTLVSRISHDMTLEAGDLILCGTSVGVGSMKPGSVVSVEIDGIGTLTNPVE